MQDRSALAKAISTRQPVEVDALHPAVAAPLADVVTKRLSLCRLTSDDLNGLAAMFTSPDVWRYGYGRGLTRVETEAFLTRQLKLWSEFGFGGCGVREVVGREVVGRDLVGVVGLSVPMVAQELLPAVTVGWLFSPTVWGKGYAAEATTAVLDQAFTTMALDRVGCVTNAENLRSVRLADRLGMSVIAEARVPSDDATRMVTATLFQVTREDWLTARTDRGPRL
jgi:RimJ/RimL family protein N-acetyltransferase